jgi:2-iminobutanoate/2-iminopropanoate deaminase
VSKSAVRTDRAPAPFQGAPYNQAIVSGGFVFVSGQGSLDAATGKIVEGDVREQTQKTFDNLAAILEAAGSSLDRVVKTTVFMADLSKFGEMNAVYAERMGQPYPARSTIQAAALPGGIGVEIEVIAEAS